MFEPAEPSADFLWKGSPAFYLCNCLPAGVLTTSPCPLLLLSQKVREASPGTLPVLLPFSSDTVPALPAGSRSDAWTDQRAFHPAESLLHLPETHSSKCGWSWSFRHRCAQEAPVPALLLHKKKCHGELPYFQNFFGYFLVQFSFFISSPLIFCVCYSSSSVHYLCN